MEMPIDEIILRTVTEGDIEEIARMWDCPNEVTIEDAYQALKYMEQTHNKNRPKAISHLCLAVFHKENPKKIIGWCGLDGEAEPGKTVLFYSIDKEFRNKGYATQCVMELLKYAFGDMEYDVIYGGCSKDNYASYRVMQKAGMRNDAFYENGDPVFYIDKEAYHYDLKDHGKVI